jgi:hypothetical protein
MDNMQADDYHKVFKPIEEPDVEAWAPGAKSPTANLFRQFLDSGDQMVEVNLDHFPFEHRKKGAKTTKQDSFSSAFYAWKRNHKETLSALETDIILIRRGERVALRKVVNKK